MRNCVARSLLAIYRSSVSETPPKSSALGIQRRGNGLRLGAFWDVEVFDAMAVDGWWLFCFSNVK